MLQIHSKTFLLFCLFHFCSDVICRPKLQLWYTPVCEGLCSQLLWWRYTNLQTKLTCDDAYKNRNVVCKNLDYQIKALPSIYMSMYTYMNLWYDTYVLVHCFECKMSMYSSMLACTYSVYMYSNFFIDFKSDSSTVYTLNRYFSAASS